MEVTLHINIIRANRIDILREEEYDDLLRGKKLRLQNKHDFASY